MAAVVCCGLLVSGDSVTEWWRSEIGRVFEEIDAVGEKAALLRPGERSDVDVLFFGAPDVIESVLERLGWVPRARGKVHRWYLLYNENEGQWLHLDGHFALKFGTVFLEGEALDEFQNRIWWDESGWPRLELIHEDFLHFLHLCGHKGRIPADRRQLMRRLERYSKVDFAAHKFLFEVFPFDVDTFYEWCQLICGCCDEGRRRSEIANVRHRLGIEAQKSIGWTRGVGRRLKKYQERDFHVAVLGPDGTGKTTLTNALSAIPHPPIRRQYMGPSNEREMRRPLAAILKLCHEQRKEYGVGNGRGWLARVGWNITNYIDLWERRGRQLPSHLRGIFTVYDRYTCDVFVRHPSRWRFWVYVRAFPSPDFVVLCSGDPVAIHERKPELEVEEIEAALRLYRRLIEFWNVPFVEVNTTSGGPEDSLAQIVEAFSNNHWFRNKVRKSDGADR